jgi:hypothetical protein
MIQEIVGKLLTAYSALGDAVTMLLTLVFETLGLKFPVWINRLTLLFSSALTIWGLKRKMPPLILIVAIILAASILVGFL